MILLTSSDWTSSRTPKKMAARNPHHPKANEKRVPTRYPFRRAVAYITSFMVLLVANNGLVFAFTNDLAALQDDVMEIPCTGCVAVLNLQRDGIPAIRTEVHCLPLPPATVACSGGVQGFHQLAISRQHPPIPNRKLRSMNPIASPCPRSVSPNGFLSMVIVPQ